MPFVSKWLNTVFGDQTVFQYEVNTRTVEILYQLAEASATRCNETALIIDDLKQKTSEYQADGAHLQDVTLQGVGLSSGSLSKPASDYMSALVSIAMPLGVRDTCLGSFFPAMNNLTNELLDSEKSDRKHDRELKALRKRLGDTFVLKKSLKEDINTTAKTQEVDNAKAEERLLNMDFVKAKSKDLFYRNKMIEDQLVSRQMERRLSHQSIKELSEEIATLKQDIIPLAKKLEPYRDLSPSPSLAQVKIEEAKRELARIDAQLEMKVDFMNAAIPKGR
ncbi:HAUS augmin-like complex subunit 1 [Aplochiton taeniatus]